jgi:hypothetical protein
MRFMFTNYTPGSAVAAAGVCTVAPDSRLKGISVHVASPLAARFPQAHQVQILPILTAPVGNYMGRETKPGAKLGGFRGVPPRGRPV